MRMPLSASVVGVVESVGAKVVDVDRGMELAGRKVFMLQGHCAAGLSFDDVVFKTE
jgi:hypothetical protein